MANIEALEQVIRVLENVADNNKPFIMRRWVGPVYREREIRERSWFGREHVRFENEECGTAGCAIGWSASDPWFTSRGLHLAGDQKRDIQVPAYNKHREWEALKSFFDLGGEEVMLFFHQDSYVGVPTPLEVAARIRSWLDNYTEKNAAAPAKSATVSR